jgi:hypothetical protein
VRGAQPELARDQRRGNGGVHIAVDDHPVRTLALEDRRDAFHDARGLLRMTSRSDAQIDVGLRDREVAKECARQSLVVVLAGVDDDLLDPGDLASRAMYRCEFRKVRPGADDVKQLH